jgi:hypothetical protein
MNQFKKLYLFNGATKSAKVDKGNWKFVRALEKSTKNEFLVIIESKVSGEQKEVNVTYRVS